MRVLAGQVTADIAAEGRPAVRVGMKLRYAPFETRTRSLTLPGADLRGGRDRDAALELLGRFDHDALGPAGRASARRWSRPRKPVDASPAR